MKRHSIKGLVLAAAAAASLAACATPTPYQPVGTSGSAGGFAEQRLTENRFRVSFQGNSLTKRDTVENYLLFRAAELTELQGYDWFRLADRTTERDRRTYVDRDPFGYGRMWYPNWYYPGRGYNRWSMWGPGSAFYRSDFDVSTVDRYQATAEIVMGKGPPPNDDRVFNAREVMTNLRPIIVLPS